MKQPFQHNIIAMIWDFDKTLASDYMQAPIFKRYGVSSADFWKEANELVDLYKQQGITVNKDTVYLNHFLTCVEQGVFPGLNNQVLRELGSEIPFYDGIPEFLTYIKERVQQHEGYRKHHIAVEHYIVSTGLAEMIRGSKVAAHVDDIWGCEFIEEPIPTKLAGAKQSQTTGQAAERRIQQIAFAIDNTSKTRALFEINKGSNKENIDVNSSIPRAMRRVPFEHMIYIADGPSDVPAFSILKQNGGKTFAVYPKGSIKHLRQVDQLREDDRIDMYGEADYTEGTLTHLWLTESVMRIAEEIYQRKEQIIQSSYSMPPGHLNES